MKSDEEIEMIGEDSAHFCVPCMGFLQADMYEGYWYCPKCKTKFVDDWVLKRGGSKIRDASGKGAIQ